MVILWVCFMFSLLWAKTASSQVAHTSRVCSMKRAFLLAPGYDLSLLQAPQHKFPSDGSFYSTVRGLRVKCHAQEHITMPLASTRTRTARSAFIISSSIQHSTHPNSDFVDAFDVSETILFSWCKHYIALIRSKISISITII